MTFNCGSFLIAMYYDNKFRGVAFFQGFQIALRCNYLNFLLSLVLLYFFRAFPAPSPFRRKDEE
jgi:hypothetical protein